MAVLITEVAQGQAGYLIQPPGGGLVLQQALQKPLQFRTHPVHPVSLGQLPPVGGAQGVVVR